MSVYFIHIPGLGSIDRKNEGVDFLIEFEIYRDRISKLNEVLKEVGVSL